MNNKMNEKNSTDGIQVLWLGNIEKAYLRNNLNFQIEELKKILSD